MTHFIFATQQPPECLLASSIHKWLCQQNTNAVGLLQQGIMYPSLNFPYSFISQPLKKKQRDLNEDLYILVQSITRETEPWLGVGEKTIRLSYRKHIEIKSQHLTSLHISTSAFHIASSVFFQSVWTTVMTTFYSNVIGKVALGRMYSKKICSPIFSHASSLWESASQCLGREIQQPKNQTKQN